MAAKKWFQKAGFQIGGSVTILGLILWFTLGKSPFSKVNVDAGIGNDTIIQIDSAKTDSGKPDSVTLK